MKDRAKPLLVILAIAGFLGATLVPVAKAACPNEAIRDDQGSTHLPGCRAYELVVPPNVDGRLVGAISTFETPPTSGRFPTELASPVRDSIVYGTYSSPLLSVGEPNGVLDVYQAERSVDSWQTIRRSSPGSEAMMPVPGGVSTDHLYTSANVGGSSSPMALGGDTDYLLNPDGSHELTGVGSLGSEPFAETRWISEAGEHIIFTTGDGSPEQSVWCFRAKSNCEVRQLEPSAPTTGTGAVYEREADGPTRVVSLLPGEVTPAAGEEAFYKGASKDGATVAFAIEGTLYVRGDNAETLEVAGGEPSFAGLSDDGRYLFYVSGGDIHRFDTATEEDDQVNSSGDGEVANVSADGSHVYFLSESQLDGSEGVAGQPNLYAWSGASSDFVATVAGSDLEWTSGQNPAYPSLDNWTTLVMPRGENDYGPGASSTRTTPDGEVLVFESRAQLTPYDNDGHTEVYRYDDGDKSLVCPSCNPNADSATADARLQDVVFTSIATVINNVTDDGTGLFFETPEALVEGDVDGVNDIYQWRGGEGEGASLDLISSGQSANYPRPGGGLGNLPGLPTPNVLLSVTPDGDDVVFISQDVLVAGAGEGGTTSIYDARVGGGFPVPVPTESCTEEGCRQPPTTPPSLLGQQSEGLAGGGNVKPRKHPRRCRRTARQTNRPKRCAKKSRRQHRPHPAAAPAGGAPGGARPAGLPSASASGSSSEPSGVEAGASVASVSTQVAGLFDEFGIESVGGEESTSAAGMHPDFITDIALNHFINKKNGMPESSVHTEEISVSLPPGVIGNPTAIPSCKTGQLVAFANCPIDSQVGVAKVLTTLSGELLTPVYNVAPPHPDREIARLGFWASLFPVFVDVKVDTAGDYSVIGTVHSSPGLAALLTATTTLWGNPADPIHDPSRYTAIEALQCKVGAVCTAPGGGRVSGLPPTVFMTNPSACQDQEVGFAVKSYQLPGQVVSASAPLDPTTDCSGLPFDPSFEAQPTNRVAGAPTGLKATLKLPQIEDVSFQGTATMREARVTLPEKMTIAAGAADGLAACSEQQVGYKEEVDAGCPDASKLGTATITSPALPRPLEGEVFQRTPRQGHLFGLWLVTDELGLHVKLPGEIELDPNSGQLTAVFSDLPQVPAGEIELNVWGGPRAPLKNPDSCGTYATSYTFTPHSQDPPVSGQSQMTIDQGCGGGFSPKLHAGVTEPVAGGYSPFVLDLAREDGEQNLAGVQVTLPKGELAKLAGVPLCPDTAAATGACPADSKIGSLTVAAGPGPAPLWIPQPGKSPTAVYLAGTYKDAPYSAVTVVPAQAGPFDLGVVAVRSALGTDPETAQVTVKTDPLPQFIEGVAVTYRRIHVRVDRPGFSLNPTDCDELATTSDIVSTGGTVAHPVARFQVDGCKALGFRPKLSLKLKGSTKRGDYPALFATLKARSGDANIARAQVSLPHSAFLAQEHIRTICTRVQFAAEKCPKGSVYGKAKAFTPLLDKPLSGPVYLRSSSNQLPDLVVALRGQIEVNLVGQIDSKNGGIRTTFAAVPDAPVTKFKLQMDGGAKGLIVNSRNLCTSTSRGKVAFTGQNGRRVFSRSRLSAPC